MPPFGAFRKGSLRAPRKSPRTGPSREGLEPFSNPPIPERLDGVDQCLHTGNSADGFTGDLADDLDQVDDNYGREGRTDAAEHGFSFRGLAMRAFLLPPSLLKQLRRGTPGMGVALAKAMVFEEDPDLQVQLGEETDEPPKLAVTITSDSIFEELRIDDVSTVAEAIGIAIMLADLVRALRRDHRRVVKNFDLVELVRDLLDEEEDRPS